MILRTFALAILIVLGTFAALAQTTEFTYQGSLKDGPTVANGNYDFEFRLFDALANGAQVGALVTRTNVAVANGIFAVKLDFGNLFPGADRYLEIRVRNSGGTGYTVLDPRQRIGSAPHAVQSLNAGQLGGLPANQYLTTSTGGASFIANSSSMQPTSNFNISGNGTAGGTLTADIVGAQSYFQQAGQKVLDATPSGTYVGRQAGPSATGAGNTFVGNRAGLNIINAISNVIVGDQAGLNGNGSANTIVGSITSGASGNGNAIFGYFAGSSGSFNTFIGRSTGDVGTGAYNAALGAYAQISTDGISHATAIGAESEATSSNSVFLGRADGSDTVRIPGNLNITGSTTMSGNLVFSSGNVAVFASPITLTSLGTAGGTALCRNGSNQIANCSSSLRYKTNIGPFSQGMSFVHRLRPIAFDWKDGGMKDIGFGAEDIARIDARFVTYNDKGEVEGVKYDRLSVAFVNAFNEQQTQIEAQQKRIDTQEKQIEALTKALCSLRAEIDVCKQKE